MRDPLRPIPAPSSTTFWEHIAPPPTGVKGARGGFDPLALLGSREGDALGLDRRLGRREDVPELSCETTPKTRSQALVRSGHRRVDAVAALCSHAGWALVRTLSLSPHGVLLHHLDISDGGLCTELKERARLALAALSPVLGSPSLSHAPRDAPALRSSSPLANLGTHLLGRRVVADAAAWSQSEPRSSARPANLEVSLVLAPRATTHGTLAATGTLLRLDGRLSQLNDPDPRVLGVALDRHAAATLRDHLCGSRAS